MKLIPKLDPSIPLESILFILYLPLLSSPLRAAPHHRLHSKSSSSQLPHLPPIPHRLRSRLLIPTVAKSRPPLHPGRTAFLIRFKHPALSSGASHRKLRNRWIQTIPTVKMGGGEAEVPHASSFTGWAAQQFSSGSNRVGWCDAAIFHFFLPIPALLPAPTHQVWEWRRRQRQGDTPGIVDANKKVLLSSLDWNEQIAKWHARYGSISSWDRDPVRS